MSWGHLLSRPGMGACAGCCFGGVCFAARCSCPYRPALPTVLCIVLLPLAVHPELSSPLREGEASHHALYAGLTSLNTVRQEGAGLQAAGQILRTSMGRPRCKGWLTVLGFA